MRLRLRQAMLRVEALEDRTVPTLLPNPLLDGGHAEFAHLAFATDCGEDPSITGRCAPELPEWMLSLLHGYAQTAVDVVLPLGWGREARDIYRAFLDGPFDQRDYADGHEVVEGNAQAIGFRASPVTRQVTQELFGALRTALEEWFTVPPPKGIDCGSLPVDVEFAVPIRRSVDEGLLTSRQLRDFELSLEYSAIQEIPGILAGGISDSMGAGMDDRAIDGFLMVTRHTLNGQTVALDLRTALTISVYDSIDFCPGALGDWLAQFLTRPLQLLQANGWAQAVPFTVTFTPKSLQLTLQGEELPASCRGPEPASEGDRSVSAVELANGMGRPERRSSPQLSDSAPATTSLANDGFPIAEGEVRAVRGKKQDPDTWIQYRPGASAARIHEWTESNFLAQEMAQAHWCD